MTPEDVTEPCPRCLRNRRLGYWHDRHDHHVFVRPGLPLIETVNSELRARAA